MLFLGSLPYVHFVLPTRDKESKAGRCWDSASCHVLRFPLCEKDLLSHDVEDRCSKQSDKRCLFLKIVSFQVGDLAILKL